MKWRARFRTTNPAGSPGFTRLRTALVAGVVLIRVIHLIRVILGYVRTRLQLRSLAALAAPHLRLPGKPRKSDEPATVVRHEVSTAADQPAPAPGNGPMLETGTTGDPKDRVRNEPTSGLWIFALAALFLLYLKSSADTGSSILACPSGLATIPVIDRDAIDSCAASPTSTRFLLLYCVLIVAYSWFFQECVRWGQRCLGWKRVRELLGAWGTPLVVVTAGIDLLANILVWIEPSTAALHFLTIVLLWARSALLAVALLIAGIVLLTGLRRFALPWTVPPGNRAEIPDGEAAPQLLLRAAPASASLESHDGWRAGAGPRPIPPQQNGDAGVAQWFTGPDPSGRAVQPFEPCRYSIGLSGGGVRSAAFCSGVLQALAGTGWSPSNAEYLATVSGGGYVGVSSQIIRYGLGKPDALDPYAEEAPETRGFAQRHRYLGDDALERAQVLLALLTGWILNVALIAGPLVLLGAAVALLPALPPDSGLRQILQSAAVVCYVCAALLLYGSEAEGRIESTDFLNRRARNVQSWRWWAGFLAVTGSMSLAVAVPFGWHWLVFTAMFAGIGGVCYLFANAHPDGRWILPPLQAVSRVFFVSAWVSVGLAVIGLAASGRLGNPTTWSGLVADDRWLTALSLGAIGLIAAFLLLDQTWWSPHPFYKARLAATFSLRRIAEGRRNDFQILRYDEYSYLDEWAAPVVDDGGPKLLVCATANAEDLSLPPKGTRAAPFVFSHDYVGSPELGWWSTHDFRRCLGRQLAKDGTLQAATAISGAAVASGLGVRGRIPSVGTALALLNARLGVWLPNPHARKAAQDWPEDGFRSRWNRRRRPTWLWREVAGFLPSNRRFIYVSDGGHLDNLGLLELLRRRSRVILIVDASADKTLTTTTLDGVCLLAKQHLGIDLAGHRQPGDPLNSPAGFAGEAGATLRGVAADCVEVIRFRYPELPDLPGPTDGVLIVAKARFAATLENDPNAVAVVEAIAKSSPAWRCWPWSLRTLPTTLTANQSLTDDQFHNYVLLGKAVGAQAVNRLEAEVGSGAEAIDPPVAHR